MSLIGATLWTVDIIEAVILAANESHDEGLEHVVVFRVLGGS